MSGFSTDLLTGLAQYLEDAGIGTWAAGAAYSAAETGIVLGTLPTEPANAIALMTYPVSDHVSLSDSVIGVQIRTRTAGQDQRTTDDLDDAIFALLHGSQHLVLSTGVHIVQCGRTSGAPLGQDESGRWERSSNYYCSVHRPSANRT